MIAQRLTVIAGEDDDRVFRLSGIIDRFQQQSKLVIDLSNHRVVQRLGFLRLMVFGRTDFVLEIDVFEFFLLREIAFLKPWTGHVVGVEAISVGLWRNERWMRIVDVDIQHPRAGTFAIEKLDRHIRGPRRLMQFRIDPFIRFSHGIQITALRPDPVGVVMSDLPIVARSMTELPERITVVQSRLCTVAGTLQMKFSNHATVVAAVCQKFADQWRMIGKRVVAVTSVVDSAGVHACHKAGTTWCADRALTVSRGERHAIAHQPVDGRCLYVFIAKGSDRVKALLICAVPQNIGPGVSHMYMYLRFEVGSTGDKSCSGAS